MAFEARRRREIFFALLLLALTIRAAIALPNVLRREYAAGIVLESAVTLLLAIGWWQWLRRCRRCYVVLNDDEVAYYESDRAKVRVKLGVVWRAEYLPLSDEVALLDRDGRRIGAIPSLGWTSHGPALELCAAINARIERQGGPTDGNLT